MGEQGQEDGPEPGPWRLGNPALQALEAPPQGPGQQGQQKQRMRRAAVPGHQQHRVLRQRGDDETVQIRQRAQGSTGQQGGAAVAGGGCGGGEGAA